MHRHRQLPEGRLTLDRSGPDLSLTYFRGNNSLGWGWGVEATALGLGWGVEATAVWDVGWGVGGGEVVGVVLGREGPTMSEACHVNPLSLHCKAHTHSIHTC